jgi:uncharacterized protein
MKYQRLPVDVDPFRLVEQGRELHGKLAVSEFPRLQDLLCESKETDSDEELIDIKLAFTRSETGLPIVNGTIRCRLDMSCQRCLKAVKTPFYSELCVVFVSSDAQADNLQDGYDTWLVEDSRLFLKDFIEDEILLALPVVIAHDLENDQDRLQCKPQKEFIEALPDQFDEVGEDAQKENPFDVLKRLKLDN